MLDVFLLRSSEVILGLKSWQTPANTATPTYFQKCSRAMGFKHPNQGLPPYKSDWNFMGRFSPLWELLVGAKVGCVASPQDISGVGLAEFTTNCFQGHSPILDTGCSLLSCHVPWWRAWLFLLDDLLVGTVRPLLGCPKSLSPSTSQTSPFSSSSSHRLSWCPSSDLVPDWHL